jgi:hypothetical protein
MVIWQQYDINSNIYAKRYNPLTGKWGQTKTVDSSHKDALYPRIAINPSGNAFAVWEQDFRIYANNYSAFTDEWDVAVPIDDGSTVVYNPRIAMDANGNAVGLWEQYDYDEGYYVIYINFYDANRIMWTGPAPLSVREGDSYEPQVAVDSNSNFIGVWLYDDGEYYSVYSHRIE